MTNLECIEILIEENKKEIELMKNTIAEYDNDKYPSIKKINEENLKSIEELLTHLQQVKADLEAWEVVKLKEVDLYDVIHTTNYKQYESKNVDLYEQYVLTHQEYEIIKKALEVNDEK